MAEKFTPWDSADYLETEEDIAGYLEVVLSEGDPKLFAHALGVAARARGMSKVARDAGISREGLYKALSTEGNAEFATLFKVICALGLQLHIEPAAAS